MRLLIIGLALVGMAGCGPSTPEQLMTIDHSTQADANRKQMLDKLVKEGVFSKVEMNNDSPLVWVTPAFYSLGFENKKVFVAVAYEYYFKSNASANVVLVKDSQSGKKGGTFTRFGLAMD